jgi:50S ribosomal subunit-associated GTPase HflX
MRMIVEQGPGKAIGSGLFQQMRETVKEELSVVIIKEDLSSFDAPDDDMLNKTWIVDASGSWHDGKCSRCV